MRVPLSPADRDRVTAAVTAAETHTDGEIATIVTASSDLYRDTALHYAVAAMLLATSLIAARPVWLEALAGWGSGGWESAPPIGRLLFALLVIETIAFLIVRFGLAPLGWRIALTPKATRARRVRRRAVQYFKVAAEGRTAAKVGVLLYLSAGERMAEIVADEAVHRAVPPESWGATMAALVADVRRGEVAAGMAAALDHVGAILAEHFPKTAADVNELPDKVIEL